MKLNCQKDGEVYSIELYTEKPAGKRLCVYWKGKTYYAELVAPDNLYSSHVRVRYKGEVWAVAKEKYIAPEIDGGETVEPVGDITLSSANEILTLNVNCALGSYYTMAGNGDEVLTVADICTRSGVKVGTVTTPSSYLCGTDYLSIRGTVTGVYFNKNTSVDCNDGNKRLSKKVADFSVVIVYNSSKADDEMILLPHINKRATTVNSTNASKRVWQTNTVAASFLMIFQDESGTSQLTDTALTAVTQRIENLPEHLQEKARRLCQLYMNSNHVNKQLYVTGLPSEKFLYGG